MSTPVDAIVFAGPTVPAEAVRSRCGARCRPPAAQGDVYRAALERPAVIGIVDGYFEGVPSVWHKEILWAMQRGVHVLGAASMGALRAAELHPFGMRGVGRIFEAFRAGELEDDDEVAVLHGPAETGYVAISEAMVNVRATLARAVAGGVLERDARAQLEEIAKRTFYQERTWERLLADAEAAGMDGGAIAALRAWLPAGRRDQKRDDALAMLDAVRALLAGDPAPLAVDFAFEWTELWDEAIAVEDAAHGGSGPSAALVLDELRLDPAAWRAARHAALLRLLARREAGRRRADVGGDALRAALTRFRAEAGLYSRAALERWLADNGLDPASFERLLEDEVHRSALERSSGEALKRGIYDHLRFSGAYARLAERARRKQRLLAERASAGIAAQAAGVRGAELIAWYFERRLGRPVPDDLDAWIGDAGLGDRESLLRLLAREWRFLREGGDGTPHG